ncbi:MAG: RNA polymerase sigma-54 factor, partial [Thermodesulfobacteriota bacterium]|nr:RNA polymerase sigma-54 factor [Thermodesulfobacteriota bacterium]
MMLELRQQLKLSQQLIMTPQLQMAIKLLQLSRLELMDTIQQELEENPALEEVIDVAGEGQPAEQSKDVTAEKPIKEVTIEEKINDNIDWSNYLDEYNSPGRIHFESEKKSAPNFESFVARKESLNEHLLWQLLMIVQAKEQQRIGSLIIGNLDKDGYLKVSVEELVESGKSTTEKVNKILSLMQTFDPIGVCA